jgi:putative ABC transport system substrate-binding protein
MQAAGQRLQLRLQSLEVRRPTDFDNAFEAALAERAEALVTLPSPLFITYQNQIVQFAATNRLPAIYSFTDFVDSGGLMSYAPSLLENWHRAATYVDKILKRREAGRPARRAADEVRTGYQS